MSDGAKLPQYIAALTASIGALIAGAALGWSSPVGHEVKSGSALGFTITDSEYSWVTSLLPLGAACACIPSGFLIDAIGRQLTLVISPIFFILSWILLEFALNVWMLYAGRFLSGMTLGAVCAATPVYIGEISKKEVRGLLANLFQLQLTFGIAVIYLIGCFVKYTPINYFCITLCIVNIVTMIFLPESPTYLLKKGKEEKAEKSLKWLFGKNYETKTDIDAIQAEINKSKETKISYLKGFSSIGCIRALIICLGLMFIQQGSGIKAIIFYSHTIFEESGSTLETRFSALIVGFIGFVATLVSGFFVDKLGRRLLLLFSVTSMAVGTFGLGLYFVFRDKNVESVQGFQWVPITSLCLYFIFYSFGVGPVPWIMIAELFAPNVRGPASSMASTSCWLCSFIISQFYIGVKNALGAGITFLIFASVSVLGFFFILFLVPETKGKSLSEIHEKLLISFK